MFSLPLPRPEFLFALANSMPSILAAFAAGDMRRGQPLVVWAIAVATLVTGLPAPPPMNNL
jgi:NADPH-dependent glutamate synthase beta subunit-like oxidoreductase